MKFLKNSTPVPRRFSKRLADVEPPVNTK